MKVEFTAASILTVFCLSVVVCVAVYCGVVATWSLVNAATKALGV